MKTKIFILLLLSNFVLKAQDYKFSQFYNSPQNLNPAFTGKIKGLYRGVANYRMQYAPIQSPAPFQTISASADFGLFREQLNDDIVGVGMVFTNDRQSAIRTNTANLSVAYHKGLGYHKDHYISAGLQVGFIQRSLDLNNAYFESQFVSGTGFDLSLSNRENFDRNNYIKPNINLGILWSSNFTDNISAYGGVSMFNVLSPRETFFSSDNERNIRINTHFGAIIDVNQSVMISPNAMFMLQNKAMQWIVGSSFGFNLSGKSNPYQTLVFAGAWYDGNGAIIASTGVGFSGLQIGISYDATIKKDLSKATKSFGAIEASIIYTGEALEGKRKYAPVFCPKF